MSEPHLGRDLTELARAGALDPVVGRDTERDDVLRVLCRKSKSNPLLLGDPGVGKTALAEGLAQEIVAGRVPELLRNRTLFELQLGSLLAGTQYRGDLEKRIQNFLHQARQRRAIIFIDEIHLLAVAGRGSGMDVANLLKPVLSRGEISCIGASTPTEAAAMFRADPALERRFQTVFIEEPGRDALSAILHAARRRLEAHHRLRLSDEALEAALELSLVSHSARKNPDRALDLLEDACALQQLRLARTDAVAQPPCEQANPLLAELDAAVEALDLARHVSALAAWEAFQEKWRSDSSAFHDAIYTIGSADVHAVVTAQIGRHGCLPANGERETQAADTASSTNARI